MKRLLPLVGIVAVVLNGCGGGSSGGGASVPSSPVSAPTNGYPAAPPPGTTTSPSNESTAKFMIKVPRSSNAAAGLARSTARLRELGSSRKPLYVSVGTQSIQIAMTSLNGTSYNATAPLQSDLTTKSPNCVSQSGTDGGLLCTLAFPALPVGTDGFTLTTYSSTIETGLSAASALSTNKVTGQIYVGEVTNIPVTLAGIIAKLNVSLENAPAPLNFLSPGGTQANLPIIVTEDDASGAQIIGSYPFQNTANVSDSINITTDDSLNTISIASANLNNPGLNDAFSYSGVALDDGVEHITATDALNGSISASAPLRVNLTAPTLTIQGTPIDALPLTGFPQGTTSQKISAYNVSAGADSVVVVKDLQPGWGVGIGHSFAVDNQCDPSVIGNALPSVVLSNTGPDTFTLTAQYGTGGGIMLVAQNSKRKPADAPVAVRCAITFASGEGFSDVINYALTATGNGGNFQVQGGNKPHP